LVRLLLFPEKKYWIHVLGGTPTDSHRFLTLFAGTAHGETSQNVPTPSWQALVALLGVHIKAPITGRLGLQIYH